MYKFTCNSIRRTTVKRTTEREKTFNFNSKIILIYPIRIRSDIKYTSYIREKNECTKIYEFDASFKSLILYWQLLYR